MVASESSRRELHGRLKEAFDVETADLVLDHLPPANIEFATKSDIAILRSEQRESEQRVVSTLTWRIFGFFGVTFAAMFGGFAALVAALH
jgi:hypothetical protein